MRCASCRGFAPDDAEQCPHCGAPLRPPPPSGTTGRGGPPLSGPESPPKAKTTPDPAPAGAGRPPASGPRVYPWQEGPADVRGGPFQRAVSWALARLWWLIGGFVVLIVLLVVAARSAGALVDFLVALALLGSALSLLGRRGLRALPFAVLLGAVAVALGVVGIRALASTPVTPPATSVPAPPFRGTLPGVTARTVTFVLTGNVPWTDTGLTLTVGETVHIVATGVIDNGSIYPQIATNGPAGQGLVTADGGCTAAVTPQHGFLAPGLPCWSLIGRVGAGAPFAVGPQLTWTVNAPGTLWLGVNNNVFGHSTGAWTVTVTVSHAA